MEPFIHYLLAKRAVDDRSLHPRLWHAFLAYIDDLFTLRSRSTTTPARPVHLLDLGCGIGTMFERIGFERITGQSPGTPLVYTAVDSDSTNLKAAADRLHNWSTTHGFACDSSASTTTSATMPANHSSTKLYLTSTNGNVITVRLICADIQEESQSIEDVLSLTENGLRDESHFDGVIAHAFMDLVECRPLLTRLLPHLTPQAQLYLTINFDGMTVFEPVIDETLDRKIEALYHATMDTRRMNDRPAGHSKTGRRLFHDLRATGYHVVDMASSDWTVFPKQDGYTKDDADFLYHILDFVADALDQHPDLPTELLDNWLQTRRSQIANAELFYMAHQLDYLARPANDAKP
jgi:SAM-dependent methyltransferase